MDDFTRQHLEAWWDTTRSFEDDYAGFEAFVLDDLEYWSEHGWAAAFSAFDRVVAK